ncbi:MAG: phosphatase PAP2 family protein [Acidobacteriota bacterium]
MSIRFAVLIVAAAALASVAGPGALLAAEDAPGSDEAGTGPARTFGEAFRTYLDDGRYLFTFPRRAHPKGAWLTAGLLAGTALLIGRDDEIRREVVESDEPALDDAAEVLEPLGRSEVEAAALGTFYLVGRISGNRRLRSTAATSFEAYLWTLMITSVTKGIFRRERPNDGADSDDWFDDDTIFPSGHTSRSFAIAAVLADRYGRKAAWTAYPLAALVGLATLQEDSHWASDILAGAGLGLAVGKGIVSRHPGPVRDRPPAAASMWRMAPLPGGAAVSIAF